jgi:UDPglucose 6-dehydrogenase
VLSARLQAAGARVRAYDPVAEPEARKLIRGVEFKDSPTAAGEGADAIVLVTEWPEFAELDLAELAAAMRGNVLIDGRNFLAAEKVREAGLAYEGIGRSSLKAREPVVAT